MNEILVTLVEKFPLIYDRNNVDFKDNEKKNKAWIGIAKVANASVEECMRVWRNLRERYAREAKAIKRSSRDAAPVESKWYLYKRLCFLEKHVKPRQTSANFNCVKNQFNGTDTASIDSSSAWNTIQIQEIKLDSDQDENEEVASAVDAFAVDRPDGQHQLVDQNRQFGPFSGADEHPTRKRKSVELDATEEADTEGCVKQKTGRSSDIAFGTYVGMTLSELPLHKRNKIKIKIVNILHGDD